MKTSGKQVVQKLVRIAGPLDSKLALLRAHVLAKGLWNASCWPRLGGQLASAVHAAIMKSVRVLWLAAGRPQVDDETLCREARFPPPLLSLRWLRCSLLLRLVQKQHGFVLSLLAAAAGSQASWLQLVRKDLE